MPIHAILLQRTLDPLHTGHRCPDARRGTDRLQYAYTINTWNQFKENKSR